MAMRRTHGRRRDEAAEGVRHHGLKVSSRRWWEVLDDVGVGVCGVRLEEYDGVGLEAPRGGGIWTIPPSLFRN